MEPWLSAAAVALWSAVHVYGVRLSFLGGVPRSRWLSAAGGTSVAYALLHLLPEVAEGGEELGAERVAWLVALAGLVAFYGAERLVRTRPLGGLTEFRLHVGTFVVYLAELVVYAIAIALHLVVTDHGLREHHEEAYDRRGRWVLVAALVAGWASAFLVRISDAAVAGVVAFLAGGIVMNVLREELPEERKSRFGAFLLGAVAMTLLLLAAG